MATHSSILAWEIPLIEEPDPIPWGSQKSRIWPVTKQQKEASSFLNQWSKLNHLPFIVLYKKTLAPWKKSYYQPRQHIKKQRHYFVNKGPSSQGYGFSSSHVWMWELDYKESWVPKNWCFWTVVLEKTFESPLDCKEMEPTHLMGDQSWVFIGRTDVEAETPILWPPDAKNSLIRKDPDAGTDWGGEGDDRGWDGRMASPTQWTWVWINSGSRWWTGRPGMLQSMDSLPGSQRVRHNWVIELNWTEWQFYFQFFKESPHCSP